MESLVSVLCIVLSGLLVGLLLHLADGNWTKAAAFVSGVVIVVGALIPSTVFMMEQNAARLASERAACESAGWLWAHDEEACINEQGWTVDVR